MTMSTPNASDWIVDCVHRKYLRYYHEILFVVVSSLRGLQCFCSISFLVLVLLGNRDVTIDN